MLILRLPTLSLSSGLMSSKFNPDFNVCMYSNSHLTRNSTDAKTFNLYLVNNAAYPPVSEKIATDVKTSDGSYTIDSLTGVTAGYVVSPSPLDPQHLSDPNIHLQTSHGFQINLQSDETMNTGILAQSEQFNVTGSAQSSSTSSSSTTSSSSSTTSGTSTGSTSTTGTATTTNTLVTSVTGTATGSQTTGASGAASSTGASASGTSSQTAVPSTGAAAVMAHPAAAAGLLAGAGALVFAL